MIRFWGDLGSWELTFARILASLNEVPIDRKIQSLKKQASWARARREFYEERMNYYSKLETNLDKEACDIEDREKV